MPEGFEAANALGAALSRVTTELTVVADTRKNISSGRRGYKRKIPSNFSKKMRKSPVFIFKRKMYKDGRRSSSPMEIIEEEEFNVVRILYLW